MLYCVITSILMIDNILPFLACAILDLLVLIALIVVAVIIGKPLSYLKCGSLHLPSGQDGDSSALAFTTHLKSYLNKAGEKIDYINWIGASKAVCLQGKAIWGLCIALWYVSFLTLIIDMLTGTVSSSSSRLSVQFVSGGGRRARWERSWTVDPLWSTSLRLCKRSGIMEIKGRYQFIRSFVLAGYVFCWWFSLLIITVSIQFIVATLILLKQ